MLFSILACTTVTPETGTVAGFVAPTQWGGTEVLSTTWATTAADCGAAPEAPVGMPLRPVLLMQALACSDSTAVRSCEDVTADVLRLGLADQDVPIPCPGTLTITYLLGVE